MTTFVTCPKCGSRMIAQEEHYDLNTPFTDKWWECIECGYCLDRNFSSDCEEEFYDD